MRYLLLSDIHANLHALEAVLEAAGPWDRLLVLGDLVGYGADPNGVVDRVRALSPSAVIRGNHDKAACGLDTGEHFNDVARFAAAWTFGRLTPENREYLRQLPQGPVGLDETLEMCHGAPFDEDYYLFDVLDAHRAFAAVHHAVCLFGHTHLPVVFTCAGGDVSAEVPDDELRSLERAQNASYLLNPGSVGQPRDGDARAAFAVYEEPATFVFRRVDYDVAGAQRRILDAGLPGSLASRLAIGR